LDLKRYIVLVLFIIIALISAGCAGSSTQYPPTIPPREVTSVPTTDPNLPTATTDPTLIAATPSGIDSGGGTYTTRNGKLSFEYPQGWFVQESGSQVIIANDRAAFTGTVRSGIYQINLVVSPIGELAIGSDDAVQTSLTAQEVLAQLAEGYQTTGTEVSAPFEDSIGGRPTYFVRINNASTEAILGVLDLNGTHVALAAVAARGELSLLEPVARTVGASVEYTP
jgi:hypothetical protein